MSRIVWNAPFERTSEYGVDRGVLFLDGQPGVPWNGLIAVEETKQGETAGPVYVDGVRQQNEQVSSIFSAKLSAITYPEGFDDYRDTFNLAYRTRINGNGGPRDGYKLHLVYNAFVLPSDKAYVSNNDLSTFAWDISTVPEKLRDARPTSHLVIDTTKTAIPMVSAVESYLYGSAQTAPRMPTIRDLIKIFGLGPLLEIIDNNNGTFTAIGEDDVVTSLDADRFRITADTVVLIDEDYFTVSTQ